MSLNFEKEVETEGFVPQIVIDNLYRVLTFISKLLKFEKLLTSKMKFLSEKSYNSQVTLVVTNVFFSQFCFICCFSQVKNEFSKNEPTESCVLGRIS